MTTSVTASIVNDCLHRILNHFSVVSSHACQCFYRVHVAQFPAVDSAHSHHRWSQIPSLNWLITWCKHIKIYHYHTRVFWTRNMAVGLSIVNYYISVSASFTRLTINSKGYYSTINSRECTWFIIVHIICKPSRFCGDCSSSTRIRIKRNFWVIFAGL